MKTSSKILVAALLAVNSNGSLSAQTPSILNTPIYTAAPLPAGKLPEAPATPATNATPPAPFAGYPMPVITQGTPVPAPGCATCQAAEAKPEEKPEESSWCKHGEKVDFSTWLFGKDAKLDIGGWGSVGYHTNSTGMFNDQPNRINLHQAAMYAEKVADGKEGFDWGFKALFIYGIDGVNTQAFGNPPGTWDYLNGWGQGLRESWALPELYAQFAYKDFSVKMGHFFTIMGYEVVPATGNFFYSHAFTFNFSEPFTHTGVLGTYKVSDKLTTNFGWVSGNDTGFQMVRGGSAFLGSVSYNVTDTLTFGYALNIGDLGYTGNGYHQTILFDWKPTKNINYVLQSDIVQHDNTDFTTYHSQGINNYLFYTVNDCLKFGTRAEWWRVLGSDYYEVTCGMNISPHANIKIRPEYRYQWVSGDNRMNLPVNVNIFGIDVVMTY